MPQETVELSTSMEKRNQTMQPCSDPVQRLVDSVNSFVPDLRGLARALDF